MLFKVLDTDCSCLYSSSGKWLLPQRRGQPGDWMPVIKGALVPCRKGYHLCREGDLFKWIGPVIFEAEYQGERQDYDDKVVVRQARLLRRLNWDGQEAQLFAADCAEHVLHLFENERPDDNRPRQAIEVARQYAVGLATERELLAARGSAWDAVWGVGRHFPFHVARFAAEAAARAAGKPSDWSAFWLAARDVALCPARHAGRKWQTERLVQYLVGDLAKER